MRFFREHWRDFRLAVQEFATEAKVPRSRIPYALSVRFLERVNRPKSRLELFLDKNEELKPS